MEDARDVADKIRATKEMHILTLAGNTVGIEAAKAIGSALEVRNKNLSYISNLVSSKSEKTGIFFYLVKYDVKETHGS